MNIFASIFITVSVIYVKTRIIKDADKYNNSFLTPAKYTVMVQNLPVTQKKENILSFFKNFFKENIVDINMCYQVKEYYDAFDEKMELIHKLNKLQLTMNK